jgi:hypothetical protein
MSKDLPFGEEEVLKTQKVGLKNVSSQKSIFDDMPKKPTQADLEKKVSQMQERESSYKIRAAELALQYNKMISDKTLRQNKNIFDTEVEKELLTKMAQLATEINNDRTEAEGMGSLAWISLLLKISFYQRDRINHLEYSLLQMEKKLAALDKLNKSG